MKPQGKDCITIIASQLRDLDPSFFEKLEDNDILFTDSTHVSKVNSDVNFIFFEVMPRLKRGVHIHVHDISYPLEYIKEWIYEGWTWQEIYLLRGFLQDNLSCHIKYFQDFMFTNHRLLYFEQYLPLCLKIWL